jgi:glutamate-1-semialdehyde 2,1-aminomutase
VLIFDETITGFRFANGGAQEYFGVIPDLATFGKGLANGYPVSALAGKSEIMRMMEEIFFSFTFGGEALSLAAALATLKNCSGDCRRNIEPARKKLDGLNLLVNQHGVGHLRGRRGVPAGPLCFPGCAAAQFVEMKTLFLQEMFSRESDLGVTT